MTPQRKIKVTAVRRERLDEDKLSMALWMLSKSSVKEKRQREAEEKQKRAKTGSAR
jgi:hypothetical protein